MKNLNFKVLSIDAWSDGEGGWTWNNWFYVDEYREEEEGPLNEENALKFFYHSLGYKGPYHKFKALYSIEDDQYNLVLTNNHESHGEADGMPRYAIEYGGME